MKKKNKFSPNKFDFYFNKKEDQYLLIRDNQVVAKMHHVNYWQGLPYEWTIYKMNHKISGPPSESLVFAGKIPSDTFAKSLLKNILPTFF